MINVTIPVLVLRIFRFYVVTFLSHHLMGFTYLNVSQEVPGYAKINIVRPIRFMALIMISNKSAGTFIILIGSGSRRYGYIPNI